jgi:hypothetical protein
LVELLRAHKREQDAERIAARELWEGGSWVFASEAGPHVSDPLRPWLIART